MSLGLNIDLAAGPGRPAKELTAEVARELEPADLALLSAARDSKPPEIKRLSDRHHALARLLAAGTPESEAAIILDYTVNRISILKSSPAFQELVAFYRESVDRQFVGVLDHMAGLSRDALLEIRDRLEDSPDAFSNKELLAIVNDMADRTGAPRKKEVEQTVTHNLGDRLEQARARARERLRANIEDAEIIE